MSLTKPEGPQCDGAAENQRSQQFGGKWKHPGPLVNKCWKRLGRFGSIAGSH